MSKYTLYANDDFMKKADAFVEGSSIKNRSELIIKAVDFYIDYQNNKEPGDFLAKEIQAIMSGNMEMVEKRLGNRFAKLLSDIAIQLGILQQIFKSISNVTEEDINLFRKIAVDEMKNNQKVLKYEELENKNR